MLRLSLSLALMFFHSTLVKRLYFPSHIRPFVLRPPVETRFHNSHITHLWFCCPPSLLSPFTTYLSFLFWLIEIYSRWWELSLTVRNCLLLPVTVAEELRFLCSFFTMSFLNTATIHANLLQMWFYTWTNSFSKDSKSFVITETINDLLSWNSYFFGLNLVNSAFFWTDISACFR